MRTGGILVLNTVLDSAGEDDGSFGFRSLACGSIALASFFSSDKDEAADVAGGSSGGVGGCLAVCFGSFSVVLAASILISIEFGAPRFATMGVLVFALVVVVVLSAGIKKKEDLVEEIEWRFRFLRRLFLG